jgi:hypothetical protein
MRLQAPWGIKRPSFDDAAVLYVVTRGNCYLETERLESPIPLVGGDLVMLPHGDAHILRDQLEGPVVPIDEVCAQYDGCRTFRHGGSSSS